MGWVFQTLAISAWCSAILPHHSRFSMPCLFNTVTFLRLLLRILLVTESPANRRHWQRFYFSIVFPINFKLLNNADKTTTIAVLRWSSWKIGMSHSSIKRVRYLKQRGALISSKFTPPNVSALTIWMISSHLSVQDQGDRIYPANRLNNAAFLHDWYCCFWPDIAHPKTAEPAYHSNRVFFVVNSYANFCLPTAEETAATPGAYAIPTSMIIDRNLDTQSLMPFCFLMVCSNANSFTSFVMLIAPFHF